jgi:hypothetical protein
MAWCIAKTLQRKKMKSKVFSMKSDDGIKIGLYFKNAHYTKSSPSKFSQKLWTTFKLAY